MSRLRGRALLGPDQRVPAPAAAGHHMRLMRAGLLVVAILVALVVGRFTAPEPPPQIERVKETTIVTIPGLALPPAPSPPRRRATLEDVRRDWGITGRLVCHSEIP